MKKSLLFGLFIFLAISSCSYSNHQNGMTSVVNSSVSADSPSEVLADSKAQSKSTPKIISSTDATGIPATAQKQSLAAPIIINPATTTNEIVYAANSEGILCIYDGKKYGFINEDGSKITPSIYDKAYPFSEGKACVYSNGKFGFIDNKGATVLPFIYNKASSFHEGLAYFEIGHKYGFINENGNQVFLLNCDSVSSFNEGLAYFSINGKYGYIDKTGKIVIKPIYDDAGYFKNGVAKVRLNDKVGIINKSGQVVVPINYDDVTAEDGIFITELNDKSGCTNGNGKVILPVKYTQVYVKHGSIVFSINNEWGIIDENGKVIKSVYDYIDKVPNSNLSIVKLNNKYGIVDSMGKIMVPLMYDEINYVDFRGKFYANNQANTYKSVDRFSVRIGDNCGVIDENGTIIVPCKYDDTQILNSGMIILEKNNKFNFTDKNGKNISKSKYDDITRVGDFLAFEKDNKYGFLNDKGEEVIPPTYDYISLYFNDIYNSNTCFLTTNYDADVRNSIVVTKQGCTDDISNLILENEITPKIKLFHNYIHNCKIGISFSEDGSKTNLDLMNDVIKTFRLYKMDGSEKPILYAYVNPIQSQGFPASYSGFFSLNNDKVKTLISCSECGGSAGGDYVCLYKDNKTSKIVIATSYHAGGFGGNAYGSDFYKIMKGKVSKITSYGQVSQDAGNYDKSVLLKNTKLFYNDNNLPYTKSTIKDANYVTEYNVNDKQTTFDKFKKVLKRFRSIPVDMSL